MYIKNVTQQCEEKLLQKLKYKQNCIKKYLCQLNIYLKMSNNLAEPSN